MLLNTIQARTNPARSTLLLGAIHFSTVCCLLLPEDEEDLKRLEKREMNGISKRLATPGS